MNEVTFDESKPIDGYGPGFFRIGGDVIQGAALVSPMGVSAWTGPDDLAPLLALAGEVDVVFLGTGPEVAPIPPAFRAALEEAGIGVEAMSSPTACRTYNVLLSEGRRIAAALLPV